MEKQLSNLTSCLERMESSTRPDGPRLTADKSKLRFEIQYLQVWQSARLSGVRCCFFIMSLFLQALQPELQSLQTAHADLLTLGTDVFPSAAEQTVLQLQEELDVLQRRLQVQQEALPRR